jgi:hypothetical protein
MQHRDIIKSMRLTAIRWQRSEREVLRSSLKGFRLENPVYRALPYRYRQKRLFVSEERRGFQSIRPS